jgi:hypothetical protein
MQTVNINISVITIEHSAAVPKENFANLGVLRKG